MYLKYFCFRFTVSAKNSQGKFGGENEFDQSGKQGATPKKGGKRSKLENHVKKRRRQSEEEKADEGGWKSRET